MPAIAQPQLPSDLNQKIDFATVLKKDEIISEICVTNQSVAGIKAKAADVKESIFNKLNASESNLEKIILTDIVFEHCDLIATDCADASWQRVKISNSRCSGLKLQTSTLKDVSFHDSRVDLSNFRFSKLKNVLFKDCSLDEADFYEAELENVVFQNCSLQKVEFSSAKCKAIDLRSSDISSICGIAGLAGATIDSVQLVAIAQLLAHELNLRVSDD